MNLVRRGDWLYPESDEECQKVASEVGSLDVALNLVTDFSACVQAGGNVGIWPKRLSEVFGSVYTFEPSPTNFRCLNLNCPEENVFKFNAALGCERELIQMVDPSERKNNCGALQVYPGGQTPTLWIDDLGLESCGLIYLDIEGRELFALYGGEETIRKYKPVIGWEEKSLKDNYGIEFGEVRKHLSTFGYNTFTSINNDQIACCR